MFFRAAAKAKAKESIRNAKPHPCIVTLVYLLVSALLSGPVARLSAITSSLVSGYSNFSSPEQMVKMLVRSVPAASFSTLFSFLLSCVLMIVTVGYTKYLIGVDKNEEFDAHVFLAGASNWVTIILVNIIVALVTAIIPVVVMVVTALVAVLIRRGVVSAVILCAGILVSFIAAIVVSCRFMLVPFILAEKPELDITDVLLASWNHTKDRVMEIITLELSFIPWALLACITFGIAGIYVTPYMELTKLHMYYTYIGRPELYSETD